MHISNVDKFRVEVLKREWSIPSFRNDHPNFKTNWEKILGQAPTNKDIERLGENLRSIMKSLGNDRDQGGVSRAGTVFECLVSWYLNLLFWGTPVIVGVKHSSLPKVFTDITTVNIDGKKSSSETDLIAFSIPESHEFSGISTELNQHLEQRIREVDLTIIQTKTNWNENSQIPMLWNLIYNVAEFRVPNVNIGDNGFSPRSLNRMNYAFVTMPSISDARLNSYKPGSIAVKRVRTLSGGNFWCCPPKDDVAFSLHQFPTRNFDRHIAETIEGNLWGHVQKNLQEIPLLLHSFLNLSFESMY